MANRAKKKTYEEYANKGERDAYLKTLKEVSKISSPDPLRFASGVNAAFQAGEDAAYEKAMQQFKGDAFSDKSYDEEQRIRAAEIKGELEAYNKAMRKFHGVSKVPAKSQFFPDTYYEAHLMMKGYRFSTPTKGRFIYENWKTLNERIDTVYNDGLNMRWDDFVNMAMSFYLFAREFHEDINRNKFSGAITKLQEVQRKWPGQVSLVSGPRILTRVNPETHRLEAKPAGGESVWEPLSEVTGGPSAYRPDRKVEILADALELFPDTKHPVYTHLDEGKLSKREDIEKWLEDNIVEPIGDVWKEIQTVGDEVERRSQLYNDLVKLKDLLDEIVEDMDPDNIEKSGKLPDRDKIEQLIDSLKGIADEIPNDELKESLENIVEALESSVFATTGSRNLWHRLRGGIARLSPWLYKNKEKIARSIRYLVKEYDNIWRIIHTGSEIS